MNEKDTVAYMAAATSKEDWNSRCDHVKKECGGEYPTFWYQAILRSGLAARTQELWKVEP